MKIAYVGEFELTYYTENMYVILLNWVISSEENPYSHNWIVA